MCGRYTLATPSPFDVRARFPVGETVEIERRYNIAPGDHVLAVTTSREGEPRGELLKWGLVPSWADSPKTGLKMINARVETVAERPAFRRAFERYRCLIIADGFYEWRRIQPDDSRPGRFGEAGRRGAGRREGPKQPFHITAKGARLFAFAGLWSIWHGDDDQTLRTCTILTTAANSAIAPLHDRMPIILERDAEQAWLDVSTPADVLSEILVGLSPAQTELRAVGPAVNDARYDGPECLAPPVESGQGALF
jgi:putative SOS response-associated peptidase YedK